MCDRVADDYQRLAETYINTDDVVIARVDTSKNDIHDFVFGEFPTFILYRAGGDGEKSVIFSGEQIDYPVGIEEVNDVQRLKKFVDDYKTIAPKRPKSIEMAEEEYGEVEEHKEVEEEHEEVKEQREEVTTDTKPTEEVSSNTKSVKETPVDTIEVENIEEEL